MANQEVQFIAESSLALTVRLFAEDSNGGFVNTITASAFATESTVDTQGDRMGLYSVDFVDVAEGLYLLIAWATGSVRPIAIYTVSIANRTATFQATDFSSVVRNQSTVLDKLARPIKVFTSPSKSGHIDIIRGDAYDGEAWPKLSFDFGKSIDGLAFVFTARKQGESKTDTPQIEVTGTASGQLAEPSISSTDTGSLDVSTSPRDYKYDLQLTHAGGGKQTLFGTMTVKEDVS